MNQTLGQAYTLFSIRERWESWQWSPQHFRTLRSRLTALLGGVFLFTLLAIGIGVSRFVSQAEQSAWQGRQHEAAKNAANTVAAALLDVEATLLIVREAEVEGADSVNSMLRVLLDHNPALLEVIQIDAQDRVVASTASTRAVLANPFTITQSTWYLTAKHGQRYLSNIYISADNEPYLIMAIPGVNGGVIAGRLHMKVLWETVADLTFGETGRAYVVEHTGQIIAHTNVEAVLNHTHIANSPQLAERLQSLDQAWQGRYINFEGLPVVGATAPVPGADWIVVAELAQREAFAVSRQAFFWLSGGMSLFAVLILFFTNRFLARVLFKPLEDLQIGAERIGRGELTYRISSRRQDEVGRLAVAFNNMAAQLREQRVILERSEAQYRSVVEDQTELICRYYPDKTLTFANGAYCRYFGIRSEELIGQKINSLILPDDYVRVSMEIGKLTPDSPVAFYEERVQMADGSLRWQQWTDRAIFDKTGALVEFQAVGRDITEQKRVEAALQQAKDDLENRIRKRTAELEEANRVLLAEIAERKQAEAALRDSATRIRLITDNLPALIAYVDNQQIYRFVNRRFEEWYATADIPGKSLIEVAGEAKFAGIRHHVETALAGQATSFEYSRIYPDGQLRHVQISYIPHIDSDEQTVLGFFTLVQDFTERERAEEKIRASLEEKVVLLKEIHHRVKNNLQVISSLLYLQAERAKDDLVCEILQDSQNRVKSMALIHEKLYQAKDLAHVDLAEYVQNLLSYLLRSYAAQAGAIQLDVHVDKLYLDIDLAMPCGLIINELVSNALKHAFPNGRVGRIEVELRRANDNQVVLYVRDNGIGFPTTSKDRQNSSLGLQLVSTLVQQLDGAFERQCHQGTEFCIRFFSKEHITITHQDEVMTIPQG